MRLVEVRFTGLPAVHDMVLSFSSQTRASGGLHIIYGLNEAGKSTFLRALLDLWFGTAQARTRYTPDTRLEAVLERGAQRRTLVRRLYRNQLVLRDGDMLDDTSLREWLGGFDAEAFRLLWAFDHERLRAGSDTLLDVKGEAGVSLFSAGGGIQHLHQVLVDLDQRLADLVDSRFARNSVKTLNKSLRELEAADQALRQQALRPEEWRRLCAEINQLQQEMAQHQNRRRALEHEVKRLERIRRVRPFVEEFERLETAIAGLRAAPDWTLEEAEAVLEAVVEVQRLTSDVRQQEERLQHLQAALEQTRPDPAIGAEATEIDRLNEGLEAFVRAQTQEIPRLNAELAMQKVDIEGRLAEIDPSLGWTDAERLFVPALVVDKARALAAERVS
ncbi:MAG: AAA family ATPase, partial [Alicyclobacillus sp.]|nr:AAA family ATPase [Alicyclobacillus sp.]